MQEEEKEKEGETTHPNSPRWRGRHHTHDKVLYFVIIADFPSSIMSEHALSANDSNPSQTPTTSSTPLKTLPSRPEPLPRKPSGPPPAYTPRPEFVVPGEQRTDGIHVTSDGSPRVVELEYVEVGVDIKWPDKSTTHMVRRGTSQDDLKRTTPVKNLLDFGQEAVVKVSPPASAKSGTKIHVDSSYEGLRNRVKEDLEEALERKMDKRLAEFEKALKARTKYYREFAAYMWMRHLQDSVYYAMSSAMGKEDFREWGGFNQLVDVYENKFIIEILLPSDIQHLKSATDREKANTHAHPNMRDPKSQELRWRSLDALLEEEDGMDEERGRYRRYFEFIKMNLF
jgi:hypothetical protein